MKIKKRYFILAIAIVIVFANAILGGVFISYMGDDYKLKTLNTNNNIPVLSIGYSFYESQIPFLYTIYIWRYHPNILHLFNGFYLAATKDNYAAHVGFSSKYITMHPIKREVEYVVIKQADIKRNKLNSDYDLLTHYPETQRMFFEEQYITLPFNLSSGDTCYLEGVIYLTDGSQSDFSVKYEVQKESSQWGFSFFFLERME